MAAPSASDYRLAPPLVARLVGSYLVILAVVLFAATAVVALTGLSGDLLVVLLVVGVIGLFVLGWALRGRAAVLSLDSVGYRVRLVRGAGAKQARWSEVEDVVLAAPRDLPCIVLRLRDGRTTIVPIEALAAERDVVVDDVRDRLAARRPGPDPT